MITAQQLEVRAGARLLMEDVSFRVAPGDKVGLVGRNGAGKTTLTKILAGEGPRAMLIAGGTDLLPNMKRRHQAPGQHERRHPHPAPGRATARPAPPPSGARAGTRTPNG